MSECRVYKRKPKRIKISSAEENEGTKEQQCCLVPGTPAKPSPGRLEAKKVYGRRPRKKLEVKKVCESPSGGSFTMSPSNEKSTLFSRQGIDCDKSSASFDTMNFSDRKNFPFGSFMALTDKEKDQSSFDKTESIGVGSVGIIELNMSLDDPGLIYSNAGDEKQQSCDPGLMDLNVSKEIEHNFDLIEGTCSGSGHGCLIDLNKSICSLESDDGSNQQVTQADEGDSTCLVSHAENQGLDIVDAGLNDRDSALSYLLEPKAPQPYAMSENFPAHTEKLSSKLKLGQGQGLMQENVIRDRIHVEDDDHLRSKKPSRQKLKRKKHRPKVAIDVKTRTPKPATPKQAREKKPKLATPKQTKEKKTKRAAPKKAKGNRSDNVRKRRSSGSKEVMSVNELETKNLSDLKSNPIVDINETKAPIVRALDFQLESPNAKSVDSASRSLPNKKRRSKRRRKLNWFTFTLMTETKNVKNGKKKLFTVNWFRRKRRIHMNRPRKVAEVDAKINASIENDALFTDNLGLETHNNIVAEDNHGLVICDNTLVDDGLVGYKRDEIKVSALTERSIMREIETNTSKASTGKKKRKGSTSDTSVKTKGRRGLLSKKFINFIINKLRSLHISDNILVPFKGPFNSIKKGKSSKVPKVILDRETVRVWNLLMGIEDDRIDRIANDAKEDEESDKMWEKEREVFSKRVATFIARMHQIQGDRGFRKWKGSILDSVIGVILTQNVTDRYSSNAFLSLAAKFPPKKRSGINSKPTSQSNSHDEVTCSRESMGSNNMLAMHTKYDAEDNQYFISELEINKEPSDLEINKELGKATNGFVDGLEETSVKQIDYALSVTKPKIWASRSISLSSLILDKAVQVYKTKMEYDNGVNFKRGRSKIPRAKEHDFSSMGFDKKRTNKSGNQELDIDWESIRLKYYTSPRSRDQMDSVDWEAVRLADVNELAGVILERGQHNELAKTIQNFLNRLMNLHNCLDLEWLRNTPPDLAQQYLLEAKGLGLKSVECIRLLALEQVAFPVDVNVARIVVRLGWVPLEELPEHLQIHLLELYPILDSIQIYLWPRLCTLPHRILYLLHFHMITFGKVTCTKINPNCKACPMKDICKHFKSKYASANKDLSYLSDKRKSSSAATVSSQASTLSLLEAIPFFDSRCQTKICETIIEEPFEPPAKLKILESQQELEVDYDSDGIPIIKLNIKDFNSKAKENKVIFEDYSEVSKAIVALSSKTAPARKLKEKSRLRTEHLVYELPRKHILLQGLEQTESDEDVQYHLAIWRPGETPDSSESPKKRCYSTEFELCNDETCFSCNNIREQNANIVRGTLLIPCRVANKGSFPLNGTYFQVNEVFADHETSYRPIIVPRNLIYNLRTRTAYFGSSISPMLRGESMGNVQKCFWTGIVCTRGFERSQMAPRPLAKRFYCPPSMREKVKRLTLPNVNVKKGKKKSGKKKIEAIDGFTIQHDLKAF